MRRRHIHANVYTFKHARTHTHTRLHARARDRHTYIPSIHSYECMSERDYVKYDALFLRGVWIKYTKWQSKVMGLIRAECVIIHLKNNCCQAVCVRIHILIHRIKHTSSLHCTTRHEPENSVCVHMKNEKILLISRWRYQDVCRRL